jgi:predicted nucleotidyltransferase
MDKRKAISIAKRFVKKLPVEYKVKKAFLFGSFAKGNAHKYSDVDVAVVISGHFDTFDMRTNLMRIRRNVDLIIEPHPIEEREFNDSNPLASEILKYGIPLIQND